METGNGHGCRDIPFEDELFMRTAHDDGHEGTDLRFHYRSGAARWRDGQRTTSEYGTLLATYDISLSQMSYSPAKEEYYGARESSEYCNDL